MKNLFNRFVREESGQDIIEYALLAAFISIVAWSILVTIGADVTTIYTADPWRDELAAAGAALVSSRPGGDGQTGFAVCPFQLLEMTMMNLGRRFVREDEGQDIIEYALLAAFVSVVAYALIVTIGQDVIGIYTSTQTTTSSAAAAAS